MDIALFLIFCSLRLYYSAVQDVYLKSVSSEVNQDECALLRDYSKVIMLRLKKTGFEENTNSDMFASHTMSDFTLSDARYNMVFDDACNSTNNSSKCKKIVEPYKKEFHQWFLNHEKKKALFEEIFVSKLKLCCIKNKFGANCTWCDGYDSLSKTVCNGHGHCNGSGTRFGSGECLCDKGYIGSKCELCEENRFMLPDGTCEVCHPGCLNGCLGSRAKDCNGCKEGFEFSKTIGCKKVSSCKSKSTNNCTKNQFCEDNDSDYVCKNCSRTCDGCNGNTSRDCIKCATGYALFNKACVKYNTKKTKQEGFVGVPKNKMLHQKLKSSKDNICVGKKCISSNSEKTKKDQKNKRDKKEKKEKRKLKKDERESKKKDKKNKHKKLEKDEKKKLKQQKKNYKKSEEL